MLELLKSKDDKRNKYMKIRCRSHKDSRIQDFTELYSFLYEKVGEYADGNTSNVIITLSEGQYKDALSY